MKKLSAFLFIALISIGSVAQAECVILLHGLARSERSMKKIEKRLKKMDYKVVNASYPSRNYSIRALAKLAIEPALKICPRYTKVNFVTHSLGGILVRQYLADHVIEDLNRVVMLGPPNKGSEVVDKLGKFPGFKLINGDAGRQLGTGHLSVPNRLGDANFDLGVIAGSKSINLILSSIISGEDDGKVAVSNTKIDGMKDHVVMPVSHTFMMTDKDVINQVVYYLKNGQFSKGIPQKKRERKTPH